MKISSTRYESDTGRPMNLLLEAEQSEEIPWLEAARSAAVDACLGVCPTAPPPPPMAVEFAPSEAEGYQGGVKLPVPALTDILVEGAARAGHESARAYALTLGRQVRGWSECSPETQENSRREVRYIHARELACDPGESYSAVRAQTSADLPAWEELSMEAQSAQMLFMVVVANFLSLSATVSEAEHAHG